VTLFRTKAPTTHPEVAAAIKCPQNTKVVLAYLLIFLHRTII